MEQRVRKLATFRGWIALFGMFIGASGVLFAIIMFAEDPPISIFMLILYPIVYLNSRYSWKGLDE